jgi:hypothetical protein
MLTSEVELGLQNALSMTRNGDKRASPVLGAAVWISLAAAPTFAIMSLLVAQNTPARDRR